MRKLLFLMVIVSLVAMPAAAQFQQLIEFQVKPGHEIAFENYIKKIGEAADKMESPMSWSTFSVAVLVIPINEEMARDAAECILETRLPENAMVM